MIDVYARLRIETCAMLGFAGVEMLTPLQSLKLDVACVLRLELDRAAALQAKGEAVDIKALTVAAEALERLLRPAEVVVAGADQHSDAREAFEALMQGLVDANEVTEATRVQELEREVSDLREQLARSRAGAAVPPAPTTPSAEIVPLRPDPAEVAKAREAVRIKAEMTKPRDEPWRPFVDASGIRTSHGNFNVHGIPKNW
jgi:hypothetical protein